MEFRIQNTYKLPEDLLRMKILSGARQKLFLLKYTTDDKLLDQYLKENFKTTLQLACLKILYNIKIYSNLSGELIVRIPNQKLDKLARLITYGNGVLIGSDILKYLFKI